MKKVFPATAIGALVLLVVGTFADLRIDQALYLPGNGFSAFFERLAPVIGATVLMIGAALVFWTCEFGRERLSWLLLAGLVYLGGTLVALALCYKYCRLFGAAYGVIAAVLIACIVRRIPQELRWRYRMAGIAIVAVFICSMAVLEVAKIAWGRVRFRAMQGDTGLFTPWYHPNGKRFRAAVAAADDIKSFPSGHSLFAGSTLSLSLLALAGPRSHRHEGVVYAVALAYALVVMVSRMMQGAHFLSDVTVGFSLIFLALWLARHLLVAQLARRYPQEYGNR
ncbi:phosphatase PAP2 family protein [Bifidobacterium sp. ESL0763]|uniref:phosphatase PAP2 family protein n=1 Tax=Bifidobacterium sp. ESL0763 TaxID=2983227 RepID=UPI0023F9C656|nr:phosphatase PAP2 family protein [Bifidobacterium sp. ESL0763]MDF7664260.1 phosphatase PAP2 family protein [Bifidobacterium sp. ESL0763]